MKALAALALISLAAAAEVPTRTYNWSGWSTNEQQEVINQFPSIRRDLVADGVWSHTYYSTRRSWVGCRACKGRGHIVERAPRTITHSPAVRNDSFSATPRGGKKVGHTGRVIGMGKSKMVTCTTCGGRKGRYVDVKTPIRRVIVNNK